MYRHKLKNGTAHDKNLVITLALEEDESFVVDDRFGDGIGGKIQQRRCER